MATAESSGALLLAESGRRWLGEICGSSEGKLQSERSRRWMTDQRVHDPDRIAHLIAPGFQVMG